ncbi:unnamed protein product [Rotaria magnacalcarata]|uniref:Uncharacterized protein n=1 Tax=Rotaria magnacalcarata TaxID=392030 RepID=A0A819KHT5_9BILA|nr:unnamed protein product [Rotaria magnacalcarata]
MRHDKLFGILAKHANTVDWPYEVDVNFLRLIMKLVDLASSIFTVNSRLWLYRFLFSNSTILADMTSNCNVLLNVLEQKTIVIDLNEDDTEAALIFDCSALCQIRNANGNLIGVARQYPVVHYGVLKTLYSHCATHEHFIHNSDLFKQNDTNIVMSLTSLTKDNFEDLLEVLHRLIVNSHLSCHDRKKLVLNWLAEIIDALMQEDNGLLILPLLLKLSHAIIDIEICNLCCRLLNKIVKRQRDLDVSFLVLLFDLCQFWLQSNETSIHDSYYAMLFYVVYLKFPTHGTLLSSKNDYSGFASIVKRNHMNSPYLRTFTTHCFNLILGYIFVNHRMPYALLLF